MVAEAETDGLLADPPPEGDGINERARLLLRSASKSTSIIEIGPGYNPIAPKSAGWNTHVVDHASREELRGKYADAAVDLNAIEEVDSIWQDGPLHEAVPAHLLGRLDLLIASHLIEHVPDFVGFLASAERLIRPDGLLSLAVPDRRYCFDHFKSPTMTGDVLEAHAARRARHTLRTAWNSFAYGVRLNEGLAVAHETPIERKDFLNDFAVAKRVWAEFDDDPQRPYQDHHVWYFTPAGFALVILELGHLGLIDWQLESIQGPEGFEFFVSLRRGIECFDDPSALQSRRMELLQKLLEESQRQVAPAIQAASPPEPVGEPPVDLAESGAKGFRASRIGRLARKARNYLRGSVQQATDPTIPS